MKKVLIIIIVLLLIGGFGYYFYREKSPSVVLEINELSLKEEKMLSEVVSIKNGTLLNDEKIDTSKLGNTKIQIVVQDIFKYKHNYNFEIQIKDTENPTITYEKELKTTEGKEIDLLDGVSVTDNSEEEIIPTISGEYDFNKSGEYTIYYVAKDSSGNETKEEAKLIVEAKKVVVSNTSTKTVDKTFTTSKGFSGVTKNGVTYIDGVLIANKTYSLPSSYGNGLTSETLSAFNQMKEAAAKENLNIYISSGFRSYAKQNTIYNNYVARDGKTSADTYSARPGYSEHQTGLAFDVNIISSAFDNTEEAKWLASNCYKYGFILRFPKGKEDETGYIYESWHFRYVGVELASKLYNNGDWITLESYFGITSKY